MIKKNLDGCNSNRTCLVIYIALVFQNAASKPILLHPKTCLNHLFSSNLRLKVHTKVITVASPSVRLHLSFINSKLVPVAELSSAAACWAGGGFHIHVKVRRNRISSEFPAQHVEEEEMVPAGENEGLADEAGVSVVTKLVAAAGMPRPPRFTGFSLTRTLTQRFLFSATNQ